MRKIFIPVLTFLMLISFVSCNLDNEGILWRGQFRYPRDDKARNYIGVGKKGDKELLYYVTVDGLAQFDPKNETSNSESIINSNNIFISNSPDIAWIYADTNDTNDTNKIIYIDDTVDGSNNNQQHYYTYDLTSGTLTPIKTEGFDSEIDGIINTFVNNSGDQMLIASDDGFDNVQLYKPTLNGDTLSLQAEGDPIQNFDDELNGLIWYKTRISHDGDQFRNEFSYMDKKVTFWNGDATTPKEHEFWVYDDGSDETDGGNQIKSVAVTEDKMVVLRYSDDDTVIVYEGNPKENDEEIKLTQIGIIYEDLPSVTQSIIIENELIFVKYNGSSNSSDLYVVDLDKIEETRRSHETSIAGLNAEAFFTITNNPNDVYMLTKDKGVFKISDTTVTPVPDLRRI